MSNKLRSLPEQYGAALAKHLSGSGEAALNKAYQLGREALSDGLGILDMAMMHHEALHTLRATDSAARRAQIDKAAEFFAESLSPFEMSFRGYREANTHLMTLNASLQQAKTAAEVANQELEAFSYSVAHDLRAPLRGIDGFSQALLDDCADKLDDEGKQHLRFVRESAQQMAQLIDDLLTLSRVTRGEMARAPVDLTGLVRAALAQAQKVQPDRRVEIVVADGLTAEGDARLLKAALDNLLGNAWKFTSRRAQARIEFGAAVENGERTFFVRDNGVGFDMTYAAKLFGVFQRLHSSAEFEGTGIGLATVQRIVRRHGGRIWADSQLDHGATFYFTLGGGPAAEKDKGR
jgi:light-regulated signal transduction histidine kinase (bacteriophytochrome)